MILKKKSTHSSFISFARICSDLGRSYGSFSGDSILSLLRLVTGLIVGHAGYTRQLLPLLVQVIAVIEL